MFTNGIKLKIKNKSLAEEARIIRKEERKLKKMIKHAREAKEKNECISALAGIQFHRKWDVRHEQRATLLAIAFLKGKPYSSVEPKRNPERENEFIGCIIPRICAMVNKYKYDSKAYKTLDLTTPEKTKTQIRIWLGIK